MRNWRLTTFLFVAAATFWAAIFVLTALVLNIPPTSEVSWSGRFIRFLVWAFPTVLTLFPLGVAWLIARHLRDRRTARP
jgi:hypothetical protein